MKNNKIRNFGILFLLLLIIPGLLISPGSGEKNPEPFFGGIIVMDDDPVPSDSIQSIRYMLPCDDGVIPSQSNTSNKTTIPERSGVPGENVSSVRATPVHDPNISQDFQLLIQKNRITLSGGFTNHSSEITYGVPERTVRGRALGLMLSLAKVRINTISFRAVSENQVEISQGKGYNLTIMNPNLTEHGVDNYSSEDPVLNIISDGVLFQTQKGTSVNFTFDSVHEPGNYHLSIFNASCSRIKDITDWTVLPSGVWYDSANRTIHIDPSVLAGSAGTYRFEVSDVKRPVRIPSPVENAVPENISGSTDTGYLPGLISSRLFQIDLRHGLLAVIVDHTEYSSAGNGSQETMIRGGAGDMYLSLGTANIDNISFQPSGEDGVEINQGKGYTITITNPSPSQPMPVNISANTTLDIISDGVLFKTQTGSEVRFTFETIPEPDRYHLSLFNTSGSLIRNITDWHDLPEGVGYDPAVRTLSILPSVHEDGSVHTYLLTIGRSDRNLTLVPAEKKGLFTLTGLPFLGFIPGLGQEIPQESVSPVDQTDLDTHKNRFGRPDISITDISNLFQLRIRLDTSKSESPESKFRSDPENSGVYDDSGIRPSMTKVWEFRTGGGVSSSPTVAKGVVYIGCDDQNLYAIDAYTGEEKWRFRTGGGVSSSPDLTNGVVFFGSEDQYLYAVNATSGAEKWKFRTENMILSSPAVVNNVVYVGSEDQYLYAIHAGTGEEKWRFQANTTSSPAVVSGTVFFGGWNVSSGEHFVYAVNETTGTEKWKFRTGDGILSSPAVANGVVYVGSLDQFLYALDADTGDEKWRFQTGGRIYTTPAVANGVVYIGSDSGFMYAVDAKSGTRNWLYETGKEIRSSPAYANGRIYFGSLSQYLYVLDAMTGEEDWILLTGGDISSSPAVADGMVYFGSGNSRVFAFGEKPFLQKIRDLFFIPGI